MGFIKTSKGDNFFKETSERYLDVFKSGEVPPGPIGVKMIPQGMTPPESTAPPEEYNGTPWSPMGRIPSNRRLERIESSQGVLV